MLEIIPAIDLIDGKCVRLQQGKYENKTVYSDNPLELAKNFEKVGIKRLHLVDLDGAKAGKVINFDVLQAILEETKLKIDFGGGISSSEIAQQCLNFGADLLNLGSICVKKPETAFEIIQSVGAKKIIIAADLKGTKIAINAWQDQSDLGLKEFLKPFLAMGVNKVLCTQVEKDGMLSGVDPDFYKNILDLFPDLYLIASGGVASVEDFNKLSDAKVPAVVVGKALLEGKISIEEIVNYAG